MQSSFLGPTADFLELSRQGTECSTLPPESSGSLTVVKAATRQACSYVMYSCVNILPSRPGAAVNVAPRHLGVGGFPGRRRK